MSFPRLSRLLLCSLSLALVVTGAWAQKERPAEFIKEFYGKKQGRYPDFSYAGYQAGRSLPPRDYGLPVFKVADYGALPNDGQDDIDGIQKAVDAASAAGGGVVALPAGRFDFDVKTVHRFVRIRHSRVIIRGYGDGPDGTLLYDHHGSSWPNSKEKWLAGTYPSFFRVEPDSFLKDPPLSPEVPEFVGTVQPVAQHARVITLTQPAKVKRGQVLLLAIRASDSSVLHYTTFPSKMIGKNLARLEGGNAYKIRIYIRIDSIAGQKLYLHAPLLVPVQSGWEAHLFAQPMLEQCGIENLRMETTWSEEFNHHLNSEHDNGYDGVQLRRAVDSWVRNCTFINTSTAIGFSQCLNSVAYDCRILGNRGHNGYLLGSSTSCLMYRLQGHIQMHTFGLSSYSSGNVYLLCRGGEPSGVDCHGGLGVYNLIDGMVGAIYASGGATGNTPPGIGTGLVFWNWRSGSIHPYNFRQSPNSASVIATPGMALVGVANRDGYPLAWQNQNKQWQTKATRDSWIWVEGLDSQVQPYSLYQWLRQRRLGSPLPEEPPRGSNTRLVSVEEEE